MLIKRKLQLIGTFIYYKEVELDAIEKEYFQTVANRINSPLKEAILDPYFYYNLRLNKFQSYQDLKGKVTFGLDTSSFHQIEIFINGNKNQKFTYSDLNPETIIFPLYKSIYNVIQVSNDLITIKVIEKGSINYIIEDDLNDGLHDDLYFNFSTINNDLIISNIIFKNNNLKINKFDSLIMQSYVL